MELSMQELHQKLKATCCFGESSLISSKFLSYCFSCLHHTVRDSFVVDDDC